MPPGTTTDVECELAGLVGYVQTGLLPPSLHKRVGHFPDMELKVALRDLLDWLSLRAILRGRTASLGGRVHPLVGRLLPRLALGEYLCAPDDCLQYRVEVSGAVRASLEDWVKGRIWGHGSHPRGITEKHLKVTAL